MRYADSGGTETRYFVIIEVYAMRKPDVTGQPVKTGKVVCRPLAEVRETELIFVFRLSKVCVQHHTVPARQSGRVAHEFGRNGER